jgi:ferrous iron transport protein B
MSVHASAKIGYDDPLEFSLSRIEGMLEGSYALSRRAVALLICQEDFEITSVVRETEQARWSEIQAVLDELKQHYPQPLSYVISVRRQEEATRIAGRVLTCKKKTRLPLGEFLSKLVMNPFTGGPILLVILYYGLYKFVGSFGAGVLVDFMEETVFGRYVTPVILDIVSRFVPFALLRDLLIGDFGIITLGIRYAVALILPIVATFFLAFAVVEDSGYLPRLAMLVDALFKRIGLSGRAVIPLVLGFGCDTMATMVTRTLPTKRERVIATLLLALAVPCSAQMGVILALLAGRPRALIMWLAVIISVFILVGYLASNIMPGERPSFYMEIPPLRLPNIRNVLQKTYWRIKWYFLEVLPLFVGASVAVWFGQLTGVFGFLVKLVEYPVRLIGLPDQAAVAFLFGFFRRDYGAAGLYDMKSAGALSPNQLCVAAITMTLFLPCFAQLIVNVKERGWRMAAGMSVFILFFSFGVGYLVNLFLTLSGAQL